MSATHDPAAGRPARPSRPAPRSPGRATALYAMGLAAFLGAVVHPLRHSVVEPRRQVVLGYREPAGRRLALASQFGFTTAAGAAVRLVPGRPQVELSDLPGQAVTLILGGFRGPYVIWLWMKVEDEKQKRIHFDLIDRYTKIAALQSDYPQMWVFHIWNMAWNVSVQWQSPDRKYEWIRRAIEFGTEGYRRNPRSAEIMAQIGDVYGEKLGRSQEAAYYRNRVKEDEGRSTFLIAYEWFDRARKANDRYGTLLHGLSKVAVYSKAPHSVTSYATELTLDGFALFGRCVDLQEAGRPEEARDAYRRGLALVAEAQPPAGSGKSGAWAWARREWEDHALRFEKEGVPASLITNYHRFFTEAGEASAALEAFQAALAYENLPLFWAAKRTQEARWRVLDDRLSPPGPDGKRRSTAVLERACRMLDAAVAEWERALPLWDAHLARLEAQGAGADALDRAKALRADAASYLAYLKDLRPRLSLETYVEAMEGLPRPPLQWPLTGLEL